MPHRYDWVSCDKVVDIWVSYDEIIKLVEVYYNLKKSPLLWLRNNTNLFVTFN